MCAIVARTSRKCATPLKSLYFRNSGLAPSVAKRGGVLLGIGSSPNLLRAYLVATSNVRGLIINDFGARRSCLSSLCCHVWPESSRDTTSYPMSGVFAGAIRGSQAWKACPWLITPVQHIDGPWGTRDHSTRACVTATCCCAPCQLQPCCSGMKPPKSKGVCEFGTILACVKP